MPRPFTRKELAYMSRLIDRNALLIGEEASSYKDWCKPLEKPMSPRERKMRERIRKKAKLIAAYLDWVWKAGILPDREVKEKSAVGMMETESAAGTLAMLQRRDQLLSSS